MTILASSDHLRASLLEEGGYAGLPDGGEKAAGGRCSTRCGTVRKYSLGISWVLLAVACVFRFGAVPVPVMHLPSPATPWSVVPLSKQVITQMDHIISNHINVFDWDKWSQSMEPFWTQDFVYDTNWTPEKGILNNSTGLRQWYDAEHVPINQAFTDVHFNQMLMVGDNASATTTTYAIARFSKDFAGIPANGKVVSIRILDFYLMDEKAQKIKYNWMMLDLPWLMLQTGHRVLPAPPQPMREGWVQPPRAMAGLPAPISQFTDHSVSLHSKAVARELLQREWASGKDKDIFGTCGNLLASDLTLYGPAGIGSATSCAHYHEHFLRPLHNAFSNMTFDIQVLTCEGRFCGVFGIISGRHTGTWLGQRASGKQVRLRTGMHYHMEESGGRQITELYLLIDIPMAFNDMGVNLWDRMGLASNETEKAHLR